MEQTVEISQVILVLGEDHIAAGRRLVQQAGFTKVTTVCPGGARRQDSVLNGLRAVDEATWVAIHDGARPFVDAQMIRRGLIAAREAGAAIAAVPVKDTVKVVDGSRLIQCTPARSLLWAAQTPQIFQTQELMDAYDALDGADVTDDAELLERAGRPVTVFDGAYTNLKITTPDDLILARALAREARINRRAQS
jgi:2-C-methyl-D-erythritol 4-phosphate cytidylyltransferase